MILGGKMRGYRINQFLGTILTGITIIPILLSAPAKAFGYTDPGTGSFAYQAMYAAFIGGSFYLRKILKRFFGKGPGKQD
jgi:hypothetical protein